MSIARATTLNANAQSEYARIDADSRFTPEAKQNAKLEVWARLSKDLARLQTDASASIRQRLDQLHNSLFGMPTGTSADRLIAHRDAQTRAAQLTDQTDAARALSTARRNGDHGMVSAIVAHAYEQRWSRLTDAWTADAIPSQQAAANEYARLLAASTNAGQSNFAEAGYYVPAVPPGVEFRGRIAIRPEELLRAAQTAGIDVTSDDITAQTVTQMQALENEPARPTSAEGDAFTTIFNQIREAKAARNTIVDIPTDEPTTSDAA